MKTKARVLTLKDSDPAYGPYLFVITNQNLETIDAAFLLETAVTKVKQFFPDAYTLDDLYRYVAAHDLGITAIETTGTAVNW